MRHQTWEDAFPAEVPKLSEEDRQRVLSLILNGVSKLMDNVTTVPKLTKEQAIILTGFTGITCCKFSDFHGDVEKRLGHAVFTHTFGNKEFSKTLKELYKEDFLKLVQ